MKSSYRIPTKIRIAFSKLGSLLLLFQKTPIVQLLLPEARVLGTSGLGEVVKWSVTTIAGLGAFDTIAGATVIAQVAPSPNSLTIPATTGTNLAFLAQVTGAPSATAGSWQLVGALPAGLVHANAVNSSTDSIIGIPTAAGSYPITLKAWEKAGYDGGVKSQAFTIIVSNGGGTVTTKNFAGWAALNGVAGGADGDSDHDGIPNLMEYALQTNPVGSDGSPGTFVGKTLSFTKRALAVSNGDVTYAIEAAATLGAWAPVAPTVNNPTTISYTIPSSSPAGFARLKVSNP